MSYFTQVYNWYFDIHPFRPTQKDREKKDIMIKQIRNTKKFKLKKFNPITNNYEEIKQPSKISLSDSLIIQSLMKNRDKIKLFNNNIENGS